MGHLQRDCPKGKGKGKGYGYGAWGGTVNSLSALKIVTPIQSLSVLKTVEPKVSNESFEMPNKKKTCRAQEKKQETVTVLSNSINVRFRALESE